MVHGGILAARAGRRAPDQPVNGFVCTVGVDSIEATEKAVAAAGGRQVVERQTVPGVGMVTYFKDTEGNVFGAIQPAMPPEPTG